MALSGIEVRVAARSNIASVQRDVRQLQKTVQMANAAQASMAKNLATQGSMWNSTELQRYQTAIANTRAGINAAVQASGQYNITTRNLATATSDFNDRLARQKVRFNEVWGPSSQKMMRAAMKEQMAMQNMIVKSYKRSGDRVEADIFTPNPNAIVQTRNLRKEIGFMAQAYSSVAVQVTNWGKNMQWAGRQLTVGFSVPLTLALGGIARLGYTLDEQLVRIEKVYGDGEAAAQATNESIRKMATDTAKHVAEQWGVAGQSTLDVMAELAATGLEGPNLQAMTTQTQRASLLGDLNTEESLKMIRTLKEAYRQNNEEIEHSVNLFNEIENSTALTMNDISEGLPRVAGILQATGVSLEDTLVLMTGFKESGIDIAEGANALKSINFKAIAATPTAAKNFLRITGQDINEIVDAAGGDFMTVMYEIADIMQTLSQQEQVDLIARVFGIHQGGRTITLLNQLAQGSEGMTRANEAASKSAEQLAGTADEELRKLAESLSTRLKRVKESMLITFGEIGTVALEMVMPLFEGFGNFVKWLGSLPDWIKRAGIGAALGLVLVGPLVMLVGLFANLIGIMGRTVLSIVKLVAPFKILNMESKAAQLLQQQFGTELDKTTSAIGRQTIALEGLIQKIEAEQAAGIGALKPAPVAVGMTPVQAGAYGRYRKSTESAVSPSEWIAQQNAIKGVDAATDKAAATTRKFGSNWMYASGAISAAAGGVGMLSSVMGNQFLANASMGVMAVTGMLPVIGTLFKGVDKRIKASVFSSRIAMSSIGAFGVEAFGRMAGAAKGFLSVMTGPWGLAIGAAVAGVTYLWNKHRKEVERVKKVYEDVQNSGEALADIYGYMQNAPLSEEMKDMTGWDANSLKAQDERFTAMADSNQEYITSLTAYAKEMTDTYQGEAREAMIFNEAMRQGNRVLAESGDAVKARQAAWDALNIMSQEPITFDEFTALVEAEWSPNAIGSLTDSGKAIMRQVQDNLGFIVVDGKIRFNDEDAFGTILSTGVEVPVMITDEQKRTFQTDLTSFLEALNSGSLDAFQRADMFEENLLPITDMMYRDYQKWKAVRRDQEISFEDYVDKIDYHTSRLAEISESGEFGEFKVMDARELSIAEAAIPILRDVYGSEIELIGARKEGYKDLVKYSAATRELVTEEERLAIRKKYSEQLDSQFLINRKAAEASILAEVEALGETKVAAERVAQASAKASQAGLDIGTGIAEGLEGVPEEIDEAAKAIEDMADALVKGRQEAAQFFAQGLADEYMKEFDKDQQATRDAQRKANEAAIEGIERAYDHEEDLLNAAHEAADKALDAREKRANKALDRDFERESEVMDNRFERQDERLEKQQAAAEKKLDARQENEMERLADRWEKLNEQAEQRQEDRREAIEKSYDDRIDAVNELIEAEREAERRRQEIYEAEQERIRRMSDLFGQNIDLNMAINSGDMDAAAKISNQMAAQTQQWALDDASTISQTASERRIGELEDRIEIIEAEKEARLEALSEVEKAEDKARKEKEEAEQKHLKNLHKQQDEAIKERHKQQDKALKAAQEAERKALKADQAMRQEALNARYEAYKENLSREQERETEALKAKRQAAVSSQQTENEAIMVKLDERLEYAKENLEAEIQARIALTPRNKKEQDQLNLDLQEIFGEHMGKQVKISDENVARMVTKYEHRVTQSLNEYKNDQNWAGMAEEIARKMTSGVFGESVSSKEMRNFIKTGELPELKKKGGRTKDHRPEARHAGGVIGGPGSSRVGYSGGQSQREVNLLALKGEGVLNLKAMRTPGVAEFLENANSGRINYAPGTGDGMGMGFGVSLGIMRQLQRNVAQQTTLRGLEHGVSLNSLSSGMPVGEQSGVSVGGLDNTQISNAKLIEAIGKTVSGISQRDILIGIMTAMQESSLRNLSGGDRDSAGLFQQRPSMDWGTYAEVTNPDYAIRKFFSVLKTIRNRDRMPLWEAADSVQRSAFPMAYAKHEELARQLMGLDIELPDATKMNFEDRMELVRKQVQEAIEREDDSLSGVAPAGGRMSGKGIGWKRMWQIVSNEFPHAHLSSAYYGREGARTRSGFLSYHGAGRATDLTSSRGSAGMWEIFEFLRSKYGSKNHELYWSPAGGRQILQGRNYNTKGTPAYADHFDHVHWGMKNGGTVPGRGYGDITPAMLEPNEFVVNRRASDTFRPLLHAINDGSWSGNPVAGIDNSGSNEYNVKIEFNGPVNTDLDIERAVSRAINAANKKAEYKSGGRRRI